MPEVGGRKFPYTKKGIADAKAYAKRTGKKLVTNERKTAKNPKRKYKWTNQLKKLQILNP